MKVTITVDTMVKSEIEEAISLLNSIIGDKKPVRNQKSIKKTSEGETEKPVKTSTIEEKGITLNDLKERAKQKAQEVGRDKVKACISEFADRLTEVKKDDYGRLYKKLGELS